MLRTSHEINRGYEVIACLTSSPALKKVRVHDLNINNLHNTKHQFANPLENDLPNPLENDLIT